MTTDAIVTGNGPRAFFTSGLDARSIAFDAIPVIDFAPMRSPDIKDQAALAETVWEACTKSGFFYATNHGVPDSTIDATFAAARRFFDLPIEAKTAISVEKSDAMPIFASR